MGCEDITIASYNCNGLAEKKKRNQIFTWLKMKNYSIIFLQETHSIPADEKLWKEEWGGLHMV